MGLDRTFEFNTIVRKIEEEATTYYVAECLEIPGCVSDGSTAEEAEANLESAVRLCLSVILEDAIAQATSHRALPDLQHVVTQGKLRVHAVPELQTA